MAGRNIVLLPRSLPLALFVAFGLGLSAVRSEPGTISFPNAQLEPLTWRDVPGWADDDHAAAFDAFLSSCRAIVARKQPVRDARVLDAPLVSACQEALVLRPAQSGETRAFFERRFRPTRIARLGETDGFLTGYYEPVVEGSRVPTGEFTVPMYRRPRGLMSAKPGSAFPNRGGAFRRFGRRKGPPYFDRAAIEDGALAGKGLEICWLKDPIDAFFIHIQGSARIRLQDGAVLRLNYAAHNGQPYTPVGGLLIQRGEVTREEMSMDRIRQWMLAKPAEAKELRRQNRSFVFFRMADLSDHHEAVGGQGIPLTAGRSIAIDRRLHAYGTPFWIDAELPLSGEFSRDPFRRLTIAQDTGSAIVGPARADIYFGAGDEAGRVAGRIKHPGRFVMLLPRDPEFAQVGQPVPYPPPRPKS